MYVFDSVSSRQVLSNRDFCYPLRVRNFAYFFALLIFPGYLLRPPACPRAQTQSSQQQTTQPPAQAAAQSPQTAPSQLPLTPQQAPPPNPPPSVHVGPTIILDPAHGGTDSGARGQAGAIEKELVLQYARVIRGDLERQGFRVVLTRDGDANPSYDDRAAVANAYRDAIFISLHVSSTGPQGTARVYYYRFGSSPAASPAASAAEREGALRPTSLVSWQDAQSSHVETSHRLADSIQRELALRFSGSPAVATAVAVRGLRSVDAPAVAVEVSSVAADDADALHGLAGPLAVSISRALQLFRGSSTPGAN